MDKIEIFGLSLEELKNLFEAKGLKKFRASQVYNWMYQKSVFSFAQMHNLAKNDVNKLEESFTILPALIKVVEEQITTNGLTQKVLLEMPDGNSIETVCMQHDYGYSVCVSTQVGCNMKCAFCASGLNGCIRNLTKPEILAQIYYFNAKLAAIGKRVSRVVVMGAGEPMLNFEATIGALAFLHQEDAANMSYRNMTISTCGIIPGIEKLQAFDAPINLAISLHAASDELRTSLMPINATYPLAEVIKMAESYAQSSGRQVTYEYILIANVNDSDADAELLIKAMKHKLAAVNLIPANPVVEKGFAKPSKSAVDRFLQILLKNKISATVRKEMGKDIDAACGQLRAKFEATNI